MTSVELSLPPDPLYLDSWTRVPVVIPPGAGPSFDDLYFFVEPAETGCVVSYARDVTFDPAAPHVVLVAGGLLGEHVLRAVDKTTGDVVAEAPFVVSDVWTGQDGPPMAHIGPVGFDQPAGTWGGGDWTKPQNVDVFPQRGARRVAVVILETSDASTLTAAEEADLRTRLQDQIFDGVGGTPECTAAYFREVSHGAFDLANAGVVGPIRLPNSWAGYGPAVVDAALNRWNGLDPFARAGVAEIRRQNADLAAGGQPPLVDLRTVESILFVVRSLPAPPPPPPPAVPMPGQTQWPFGSRPGGLQVPFHVADDVFTFSWPLGSFDVAVPVQRIIQIIAMPDDWETAESTARTFQDVAAHELGHNLGLPDQYAKDEHADDITARDAQNWTLMSFEEDFPHLTTPEKLMLGWTRPEWVRPFSFGVLGPVDQEITLQAAQLGAPPAGRSSAVEVRKGDGTNYYFEYRRRQAGIGDQSSPEDGVVLATEFVSGASEPADRRHLLLIKDDADADGGTFALGDDYEEQDTTSPEFPNDFVVDVLATDSDSARIHLKYGDQKPDPQVTPWSAHTNWKSPDLEVRNARSAANSMFFDTPWEGHVNTLHVRVRNRGDLDAPGVTVSFSVKDLTLGGGAESSLGSQTRDVPAGGAPVEFTAPTPWVPPITSPLSLFGINWHYCTQAVISPYARPDNPAVKEVTPDNNWAQSNHTQLVSAFSSPAIRTATVVKLRNDAPKRLRHYPVVQQSSPIVRTYLEHAWVELDPGEERHLAVFTEFITGDETMEQYLDEQGGLGQAFEQPNVLRLTGVTGEPCSGSTRGGASILVRTGRATEFTEFDVGPQGQNAVGRVVDTATGEGVSGDLLVSVIPVDAPEREVIGSTQVDDGTFGLEFPHDLSGVLRVQGHYLGIHGVAPCESRTIEVER